MSSLSLIVADPSPGSLLCISSWMIDTGEYMNMTTTYHEGFQDGLRFILINLPCLSDLQREMIESNLLDLVSIEEHAFENQIDAPDPPPEAKHTSVTNVDPRTESLSEDTPEETTGDENTGHDNIGEQKANYPDSRSHIKHTNYPFSIGAQAPADGEGALLWEC